MKALLVPDDLDRHEHAEFVVNTSDNLPETPLAEDVDDLVSEREVITGYDGVVSPLVIIPEVGRVRM